MSGFVRSIMIVDDEPLVVSAVSRVMKAHNIGAHPFHDAESALDALVGLEVQAALVDVNLPGTSGLDFLRRAKAVRPDLEVIIMTGVTSIGDAVHAMRAGAYDYLAKPFESLDKLVAVVGHAIERSALIHRNQELERLLSRRDDMTDILGTSPKMKDVFETISAAAETPATVLVTGESGTGKELVARALHRLSKRSSKPFVAVNCSAFAESVLDSELFGHQKGAFTGATANRRGMFEAAHDATLFLDEIGDMTAGTQVRLLRALQEGEIKRVGGNDTIKVDVRVIAATNVNLMEAVKAHTFREDLYYRLNVVSIHLPPLRERIDDVPLLAMHMVKKHAGRLGRNVDTMSDAALER
ncbi:MAG TPA: sigma-54 dependent transcriptional regulator, partial [Myxococcota bacterium]